jgi:hypothetical protein
MATWLRVSQILYRNPVLTAVEEVFSRRPNSPLDVDVVGITALSAGKGYDQ